MSQGHEYFSSEKEDSTVHLLVDDSNKTDAIPPKKKCPYARPGKFVLFLAASAYALYCLGGAYQSFGPSNTEVNQFLSSTVDSKERCEAKIAYKLNQTFEYNPEEYKSLNVAVFGHAKFSTVSFERHDSAKVVIEPEIFISSIKVADKVSVGSHTKEGAYGFNVKGPRWFSSHKDCISANIVVKIPNDLEDVERLWVRLPYGHVSTDFGKKLIFQKLHIELGSGDIHVKDKAANQIELTTGVGKIKLENSVSGTVSLYTRRGDITASDIRSNHVIGGTADGNVDLTVKEARLVYAKNFNGVSSIKVESLAPEVDCRDGYHFAAGTVNGHTYLSLPAFYKGRFSATTFNGKSEISIKDDNDLHFTKNYTGFKRGYKGDDPKSPSYAESAAFNGDTKFVFV
ncbi:hypothetical protein DSO57_1014495 [Entomophthora muscae]|uniref:Uncharacterized protein n=1 Tax=Entomophthora muscae TaxID=34485 RepID=A0ACC2SI72_9FUNG|nr:hypothetical protein DSO57_1014495 [Entomophthora muscae]